MSNELTQKPHAAYVERLRRRLATPAISVEDARDGVLDCFVATYQEGLAAGMQGIVGIEAGPSEVARVAAAIFRRRLLDHGASFEEPTVEALARVKDEADEELHFGTLPVEIHETHDRVCELLLAKAEGSLPHAGDHSAVVGGRRTLERATAPTAAAGVVSPRSQGALPDSLPRASTTPLREAVATLLEEIAGWARSERSLFDVQARLEKARRLIETVHELETA